ncbi:acyltransferase domain-containing protein [Cohnella rhizosphaerae]|uniref:Acyltransferase domain-containing protein n=1 Tax=Cohnella rhizosphaerae TaxID=1457232 RepID=A0A9X4L109_9BACL|nr:acyltransferase domain-containing protein [Cohnella rhizosphaerae]MDG0814548.1 acyltransferase domain-containing protein [Cohnella rhizosphaerae]
MDIASLGAAIGLHPDASALVLEYDRTEGGNYSAHKASFLRDREAMLASVKQRADYRPFLLYFFVRMAVDVHDEYRLRDIPDEVHTDTFSDIRIWSEVCKTTYGEYGIEESGWLQGHVRLALFRLGRLQFQPIALDRDLIFGERKFAKGGLVLNVHIPVGGPLDPQAALASFARARAFFRGVPPIFVCHSWLLYPGLDQVLESDSNIMQFQRLFEIYEVDETSRQAEERIFGIGAVTDDPAAYEARTGLQRRAKAYLASGGKLGAGRGIYTVDEVRG